ncbi:DUF2142 domain-containing protein [Liquorilactobacillus hordei]|uniref:DUF2142 domain-containing protein n=1 Tax=Liquorilactobacillus hordei TaxID=468911 RepID=A0A3S6QN88_9LACO|nr:DUF2142 domain-containing protein [Liquorilactobacillus hordei]AUJ29442.1 hypothetical protein BSQ49_04040 [Liquorilactobacillus hordei]
MFKQTNRKKLDMVVSIFHGYKLLIGAVVLIFFFSLFLAQKDYLALGKNSNPSDQTVEITKNVKSKISFTSSKVYSLLLKINANSNANSNEFTNIKLVSGKKVLYSKKIYNNVALNQDGPNGIGTNFVLNEKKGLNVKKGKYYRVVMTTNAIKGHYMTAYTGNNGSIWNNVVYNWIPKEKLAKLLIVFQTIIAIIIFGIFKLTNKKNKKLKIENVFLLVSVVLITLYTFLVPAFRVPDEFQHFIRTYGILHGNFLVPLSGNLSVPHNLIPVLDPVNNTLYETLKNFNVQLSDHNINMSVINMALYSPQSYIFQLFGMGTTSLFTKNPFILLYSSRLITGLCCTLILYLCVKFIPFGKKTLVVCSLLPMNIAERASLSADGFTYVIVIAVFTFSLYVAFRKENMGKKLITLMYVLLFFLASCKVIYFIIGGIILLIPNKKFGSFSKGLIHKAAGVSFVGLIAVGWLKIASKYLINTQGGSSSSEKVSYIIHHPFWYVELMNKTFWMNLKNYTEQLLTGPLGALNIEINYGLTILIAFVLLRTIYLEKESIKNASKDFIVKNYIILICLINTVLIFTSLFVQWTQVTGNIGDTVSIMGIQGRYFLPILPLFLIAQLVPKSINDLEIQTIKNRNMIFLAALINILVLANVFTSLSM